MSKRMSNKDRAQIVREALEECAEHLGKIPTRAEYRRYYHGSPMEHAWEEYWPSWSEFAATVAHLVKNAAPKTVASVEATVEAAKEKVRLRHSALTQQIKVLTEQNLHLQQSLDEATALNAKTPQIINIEPAMPADKSESVAVMVASDWHIEEEVKPEQVGGRNAYNLTIAKERAARFFRNGHRLLGMSARDTVIRTTVLALLGDFISGMIHDDLKETNSLLPVDAAYEAETLLASGIEFLLKNLPKDHKLVIPCHSGNHARITEKQRGNSEQGQSLETMIYRHLRSRYEDGKRVRFLIAEGYHSRVELFEGKYSIRFHHGHAIRYAGGVGGPTIPILKAIAAWNVGGDAPDLDVFGHLHTALIGGNFVANGSLIGANDYGLRVKAPYQPPQQAFLLLNKRWLRPSVIAPIFVEDAANKNYLAPQKNA
jgi:hypothetical protein